jgi:hypothetical protein
VTARADIEDALHPRIAGSTEGMTLQVLAQIRDGQTAIMRDVRSTSESVVDVRERVIRLEENNRRLDDVETKQKITDAKVDVLLKDKDRRDGALGMLGTIKSWAPFLAMLFSAACVLWLYGRSAGIVPAPPAATSQGKVGGKP